MTTTTVSTRFLILSDTHNFAFDDAIGIFQNPFPKADVLLHCGDLTMWGGLSAYRGCLRMLGGIDAELKLVIAGNHELSLDGEWWRNHSEEDHDPEEHCRAMEIMTGLLAKEAGVTYLEEGTHSFTLKNGATFTIYVSPYTPEFGGWAFPYKENKDRFNLADEVSKGVTSIAQNPMPTFPAVDIVMTHGPPKGILDSCDQGHVGCENLLQAVGRARPLLHCFGHIHEGYGARMVSWEEAGMRQRRVPPNAYPEPNSIAVEFGKETLMINAAVVDVTYQPVNAPWLVDLDLPRSA